MASGTSQFWDCRRGWRGSIARYPASEVQAVPTAGAGDERARVAV
jgi:hypothetical protein